MASFIKALVLAGVITCTPAWAHEWYDAYCCDRKDCHPEQGKVTSTPKGYFVERLGETVPYGSKKIRRSQNRKFHVCEYGTIVANSKVRCLYVPGGDV